MRIVSYHELSHLHQLGTASLTTMAFLLVALLSDMIIVSNEGFRKIK
jgi:hypothetical protein